MSTTNAAYDAPAVPEGCPSLPESRAPAVPEGCPSLPDGRQVVAAFGALMCVAKQYFCYKAKKCTRLLVTAVATPYRHFKTTARVLVAIAVAYAVALNYYDYQANACEFSHLRAQDKFCVTGRPKFFQFTPAEDGSDQAHYCDPKPRATLNWLTCGDAEQAFRIVAAARLGLVVYLIGRACMWLQPKVHALLNAICGEPRREVALGYANMRLEAETWAFTHREAIEERLENEPYHGLHPTAVHAVRCTFCECVLRALYKGDWAPYFKEVDNVIAKRKMRRGEFYPHNCTRDGAEPLHIVYALTHDLAPRPKLSAEQADRLMAMEDLPEVRNNKQKHKVDHKHYRKGRRVVFGKDAPGGKNAMLFSYDDYKQFKEHIEDGHFEDALAMARDHMRVKFGLYDADAELEAAYGNNHFDSLHEWRHEMYEQADAAAATMVRAMAQRVMRTGGGQEPRFRHHYSNYFPEAATVTADIATSSNLPEAGTDIVATRSAQSMAYLTILRGQAARSTFFPQLPEVAAPLPKVLMEGEHWVHRITNDVECQTAAIEDAVPRWENHHRVVATQTEHAPPPLPEVARGTGPAEARQNPKGVIKLANCTKEEKQPPTVRKARRQRKNYQNSLPMGERGPPVVPLSQKGPHGKWVQKALTGLPEAWVVNSEGFNPLNHVAHATFSDGRKMQGYVLNRGAAANWFVTGRHNIGTRDGFPMAIDGMSDWTCEGGQTVTIRQGLNEPVLCEVLEARSDGVNDRVMLRVTGLQDPPKVGYAEITANEGVMMVWWGRKKPNKPEQWLMCHGQAMAVTDKRVAYNIATAGGHCRATVFSQTGKIVGGHYHPQIDTGVGKYPACDRDKEDLKPGWAPVYHPPPTGPRLQPQAPEPPAPVCHLTSLGREPDYFIREEKLKVWGLRTDAKVQPAYKAEYFVAKPSTKMLYDEIQKYGEPSDFVCNDKWLAKAYDALLLMEADAKYPVSHDLMLGGHGADLFLENAMKMDLGKTSAGAEALASTHHELLLDVGNGDSAEGARIVAQQAHDLYCYLSGERRTHLWNQEMEDLKVMCQVWVVQGKKDGYKLKKLHVGRSIQAPCFTFKLFWRTLFGESGDHWVSRDDRVRAGANLDHPIKASRVEKYKRAVASVGLDETAFDRYMPREFIHHFFMYMKETTGFQVPNGIMAWLEACTVDSYLLLTTGDLFQKHRGNPSGFPDTLRLNSVVQMLSWCYMIQALPQAAEWTARDIYNFFEEDVYLEVCGDDSRASCLTARAAEILGASEGFKPLLDVFTRVLPWVVKIEGMVVFSEEDMARPFAERADRFPPLVARNLTVVDGYLWQPLWNLDRCSRTFMSKGAELIYPQTGRSPEEEDEACTGTMMCLRNQIYWHTRGTHYSPLIQSFIDNGWLDLPLFSSCMRVVADSYAYGALCCQRL